MTEGEMGEVEGCDVEKKGETCFMGIRILNGIILLTLRKRICHVLVQ